ncbi:MAG: hypothetical protein H6559_27835 [Lewinellaceae bacterium]|nr:hypothetical protein [Lewinellaceae bacterium]
MEKENEYTRQVEAYLGGTMNPEERKSFKKSLEENEELTDVYREYQFMQGAVEYHLEQELREKLNRWEKEEKRGSKLRPLHVALSAAAGVLILVTAFFLFRDSQHTPALPPTEIALNFYQPPPQPGTSLSAEPEAWMAAKKAYRSGNFATVVEILAPLTERDPEMDYYLAHSYFQLGNFNAALPLFNALAGGDSSFRGASGWYYLLALLGAESGQDRIERQLGRVIQGNDPDFREKAKQLSRYWEAAKAEGIAD